LLNFQMIKYKPSETVGRFKAFKQPNIELLNHILACVFSKRAKERACLNVGMGLHSTT